MKVRDLPLTYEEKRMARFLVTQYGDGEKIHFLQNAGNFDLEKVERYAARFVYARAGNKLAKETVRTLQMKIWQATDDPRAYKKGR